MDVLAHISTAVLTFLVVWQAKLIGSYNSGNQKNKIKIRKIFLLNSYFTYAMPSVQILLYILSGRNHIISNESPIIVLIITNIIFLIFAYKESLIDGKISTTVIYLLESLLLVIMLFSLLYYLNSPSFNRPIKSLESIYYSIITFTSVGYGDIYGKTETIKVISSVEAIAGYCFSPIAIGLFVNKLISDYKNKY